MKSVQLIAADTLEVREIPLPPDPGPGEVVVKVRAVGICGSDMHWYHGGIGHTRSIYPQILGHEPAGEIAATGPGVSGLAPGQKVAIEPAITCGHCELCRAGRHNACVRSRFMSGPDMPGAGFFGHKPARCLGLGAVAAGNDHPYSGAGEAERGIKPDTRTRAGDERDPPLTHLGVRAS